MTETTTETEKPKADALEQEIDAALREAYRDGPEWMRVRKSVEALKADRRRLLSESPAVLMERLKAALERSADNAATVIDEELTRFGKATEGFLGDLRQGLERFRRKP